MPLTFPRLAACGLAILTAVGCASQHSRYSSAIKPAPFPDATPDNVVSVTKKIFPAVVRIDVAQETYAEGKRTLRRGIGSGVIIDDHGHILTNFHVAGRAAELYVTLYNKERVRAKLIGDDHWTDLAVIQLDMDEVHRKNVSFAHADLGDSDKLVVGQPVMAMGTPFGLSRTATLGIVSNTERTFYPEQQHIDEYETGEFSNWIQMDTPIAPGNSGGPLVELDGKIVGINTRGVQGAGLNFAIPINTAKQVIQAILNTSSTTTAPVTDTTARKGRVDRSDLGIDLKPLQDLETFYAIDINKGVLINSVDRNSPAAKAGLKAQDILLAVNGKPINVRFPEEIAPARKRLSELPIGEPVVLTLRRGAGTLELTATPLKLQGAVGEEKEFKTWGMTVRDMTRTYANEMQLDDDKGVVVTTLSSGYPAAKAELSAGDVVRKVNGEEVEDLDAFVKLYNASIKEKETRVLIEVQRGRGRQSAVLKVTYAATNVSE
jgi:serine protease Do